MVGERDPRFYGELKQTNDDLYNYLTKCREKSPYFDYTPTLNDYMKQVGDLLRQYPEKTISPTTIAPTTIAPTPIAPIPKLFSFGSPTSTFQTSATSATATPLLFSFSLPKKDEIVGTTIDDNNKTVGDEQDDAPPPEPNVDKYEEKEAKYSVKAKLYEKDRSSGGEGSLNLLGLGYLYVKNYDSPNKLQVIFRQEPDLRRVLLNEIVTPIIPIGKLPQKAVHILFPPTTAEGSSRSYVLKTKDEKDAEALYNTLNSLKG